jgi:hypothetical protein
LAAPEKHLSDVSVDLISRLSPDTLAFVEVRVSADIALLEHLNRVGIPFGHLWEPQYCSELHMTNDSNIFVDRSSLDRIGAMFDGLRWVHPTEGHFWPLVEGKRFYHYEFPVGEFRYWVNAKHSSSLPLQSGKPVNHYPRLAWRDVASSTNERTLIGAIIPARSFLGNTAQSIRGGLFQEEQLKSIELLLNSFLCDWQSRIKGVSHLNQPIVNAVLVPPRAMAPCSGTRGDAEAAILESFALPFELAEHLLKGFPLLDRSQPPLRHENRSTITRDLVLSSYAELLNHPSANYYRERVIQASALGACGFIPATRDEIAVEEEPEVE